MRVSGWVNLFSFPQVLVHMCKVLALSACLTVGVTVDVSRRWHQQRNFGSARLPAHSITNQGMSASRFFLFLFSSFFSQYSSLCVYSMPEIFSVKQCYLCFCCKLFNNFSQYDDLLYKL